MSAAAVSEGDLVGLSALVHTFHVHGALTRADLLAICASYGIRGGAVPWESALKIATDMKLVIPQQGRLTLAPTAISLVPLVSADMEPSDEFAHLVLTFSIGRSSSRFTLAHATLIDSEVQDSQGTAAPLLADLAEAGMLLPIDGNRWQLQENGVTPMLIGLLLSAPKGASNASDVGSLGESLTLRYYLEQGWAPLHLSPISDSYGFDVLCRPTAANPGVDSVAVEAKGTSGTGPYRFFASRHELRVARYLGQRYEIALWGEIDRLESLDQNYARLRARGFPRVIRDPYGHVETHAPGLLSGRAIASGSVSADGLVWQHT